MIIQINNDQHVNVPKTFLSLPVASGDTTYPVKNSTGFTTQYAIQIGEVGLDTTEVIIGTVSNVGSLSGPAAQFSHPADTPVYSIKFDQVVFKKSSAGTAGTASAITNGTITYQADSTFTQFDDTSGASTDAYKAAFRNSATSVSTSDSDWITPSGLSFYSLGKLKTRIKDKLWDSGYIKSDDTIRDWINEWKDKMSNAVIKVNQNYAMGTENVAFGTAGYGTVTTADFKQLRKVWVTYDGINTYRSTKANPNEFLPSQVFSSTHPYHAFHGDTVFQVYPGGAGTAQLEFYRFGTTMVNDIDELPVPFRSYTDSFVSYGLAQAFLKDSKADFYDRMMSDANRSKEDFVLESSPRDKSSNTAVRIVEPVGGDDWSFY